MTFVGNKDPVTIGHEVNEGEAVDPFAVGPATRKVRCAINPAIQRAGKREIRCDQFLNCRAILRDIGLVSSASDRDNIICFGDFPLGVFCVVSVALIVMFLSPFVRWLLSGVTSHLCFSFPATRTVARLGGASV